MREPEHFARSLVLSGVLNVVMFFTVGFIVVSNWGYDVGEVITITSVAAWSAGTLTNTTFNSFQLVGNFVSYMLDSVPLGRFCQKAWAPDFQDTWSPRDIIRYAAYTLPTFIFAVLLAVFVPSVNTLLDFTTAVTTPMVTQIYPAVLYFKMVRNQEPSLFHSGGGRHWERMGPAKKLGVAAVFLVGIVNLVVCWVKAVGYIVIPELRPPLAIGCPGWQIWSSTPATLASSVFASLREQASTFLSVFH